MNKPIEPVAMPSRNVFQRLSDARAEFHTLKLKKTGHNKFAGYNYFELSDFLIPALEVFRNHGLIGVVSFDTDKAQLMIYCTDKPEAIAINSPMSSAALKGCHEVQNLGAVQTYLRRYLWVAALEIVEHDAIDSSKPVEDEPKVKATRISAPEELYLELSEKQQEHLKAAVSGAVGVYKKTGDLRKVDDYFGACNLSDDQMSCIPYLLRGAKTTEGKNLSTAWVNYTKDPNIKSDIEESLAGVM